MIAPTVAEEARAILEQSDAYTQACKAAEADIIRRWRKCTEGTEAREKLWYALQNIDSITKQLRIIAETPLMETTHG